MLVIALVAGVALWFAKPWAPDVVVVDPGPGGTRVTDQGLLANYYPVPGSAAPGILLLGGSEGGISVYADQQAQLLRDEGYSTLALSYFGGPDQPAAMESLPLETFDTALAYLAAQPQVDRDRMGVIGSSKGGEASLLVASRHPELKSVVGMVPSSVVWQGMDLQQPWRMVSIGSTWSADGQQVPYLPFGDFRGGDLVQLYQAGLDQLAQHQDAIIPIENAGAPILLVCGESDTMWPSCEMSRQVADRAQANGGPEVTVLAYADAGHFAAGPPVSTDNDFYNSLGEYGGSVAGNAAARAENWPQILAYLQRTLGS
ncbi:hypothetical protein KILIM_035_00550 [Kineosphaera limosa NBRC 100340]|uniref:BAAT/Acyl-CoA thioester hydrolase C-terminal domain-containing protein n=1 Tax=Kineosphaera limosa NBRC 100340 TaxID=1184609 RepID=K6WRD4_9MICO|nr:hypothetical protein KILIM_035_00550 [Kineosphaera limosa NBRC 100340]